MYQAFLWSGQLARCIPKPHGQILQGTRATICYLDDILVIGETDEEHLENLGAVLDRLEIDGLRQKIKGANMCSCN